MDDFWKWFKEKTGFSELAWIDHNRQNYKTNLIGHMADYLFETRQKDIYDMVEWAAICNVEDMYNCLYFCIDNPT